MLLTPAFLGLPLRFFRIPRACLAHVRSLSEPTRRAVHRSRQDYPSSRRAPTCRGAEHFHSAGVARPLLHFHVFAGHAGPRSSSFRRLLASEPFFLQLFADAPVVSLVPTCMVVAGAGPLAIIDALGRRSAIAAKPSASARTSRRPTTTWATCCASKAGWRRPKPVAPRPPPQSEPGPDLQQHRQAVQEEDSSTMPSPGTKRPCNWSRTRPESTATWAAP
jgi:hypothetical protein